MANIIVLGAGRIGKAIAIDLAANHLVAAADNDSHELEKLTQLCPDIKTFQVDLLDYNHLSKVIQPADLVINAVPGFMGFQTLQQIITGNKNVVDISFFPEDAFSLHELAQQHDVTAIVDMGIAPGMSNLFAGYHNERMDIQDFYCVVGGLPINPNPPFYYKAPFSPIDVLEEYTRPARIVENGRQLTKEPLSDIEELEFPKAGKLEAFNTDGLRTLLVTMPGVPNMVEKTLRYPGHAKLIRTLKDIGMFGTDPLTELSQYIRPIDVTAQLLKKHWELDSNEPEFTIMRVRISGSENGRKLTYQYDLYDEYDSTTRTTSMARTTGYACTAAASLILEQQFSKKGISAPEIVGSDQACFDYILKYLKHRNITFTLSQFE